MKNFSFKVETLKGTQIITDETLKGIHKKYDEILNNYSYISISKIYKNN